VTGGERLSKLLAAAGIGSRRAVDALIAAGRVSVDGRPAVLGERVDPARVQISVDGRPVELVPAAPVYLALHKPPGVTATVRDRFAARTVLDLVPPALAAGRRLFPVGRLDRDSEGLLLLTNDGAWAERVLHPRFGVEREYAVAVERRLGPAELERLRVGVPLAEGLARAVRIRPATPAETRRLLRLVGPGPGATEGGTWYRVVLGSGWKRQLRRMFAAVGVPVRRLVRVRMGPLELGNLPPGAVRALRAAEVAALATGSATTAGRTGRPQPTGSAAATDRARRAPSGGVPSPAWTPPRRVPPRRAGRSSSPKG